MNNIKFRVRDLKLNRYVPYASIPVHNFDSYEYEYQQFIGICDSKGIEIYDGDILLWTEEEYDKVINGIYVVVWDNDGLAWKFYDPYSELEFSLSETTIEIVIGNTYDNQNLLPSDNFELNNVFTFE
jgi:hypothetical protein